MVNSLDVESGWTPLHKAFYFGRIRIAALLLMNGASKVIKDRKGRTAVDMIVAKESSGLDEGSGMGTEVLAWGNGANYQLGIGSADLVESPKRVGWLHGITVRKLGASKFHTVALGEAGDVYTWGWGRGGRLGHSDGSLATKEGAQIYPRKVQGLLGKVVMDVAAAKHHTLAVTDAGEVYSWGSNRDGKLGYSSKDTQVVPKKVMLLKGVYVEKVSAANRHSVVIADGGVVYTWGANAYGQLGYGTSDSGSNPTPIVVESIRKKSVRGISASKHHTVVVTRDGEVYSWGHKCVNPRTLHFHKYRASHYTASGEEMHFHRGYEEVNRPFIEKVAAGVVHSSCITKGGRVLAWNSRDPNLEVVAAGGDLTGKKAVALDASKLVTAVVGASGEVYTWEAKKKDVKARTGREKDAIAPIISRRILDVTAATDIWVGEKHTVALQCWKKSCQSTGREQEHADDSSEEVLSTAVSGQSAHDSMSLVIPGESLPDGDAGSFNCLAPNLESADSPKCSLPSLQILCQSAVATHVLEPRNAIYMLRYADSVGVEILRKHSLQVILQNFGTLVAEASSSLAEAPPYILSEIEKSYQSEILGMRYTPGCVVWWLNPEGCFDESCIGKRPTVHMCDSSEESFEIERGGQRPFRSMALDSKHNLHGDSEHCFMVDRRPTEAELAAKLIRNVKKKLQQISNLETKQAEGTALDEQQIFKISRKPVLEDTLYYLLAGSSVTKAQSILATDLPGSSMLDEILGRSVKSVTGHSWASDPCSVGKLRSSKKNKKKVISLESKEKVPRSEESGQEIQPKKVEAVRSVGFSVAPDTTINMPKKSKRAAVKGKRGGLSAFLSGELEKTDQEEEEIQEAACSGPAWGKHSSGSPGLKLTDIMHQQETTGKPIRTNKDTALSSKALSRHSAPKVSLVDFINKPQVAKKSGPAWGGIGATPPSLTKPSMQDIQDEQGSRRQRWPHSAKSGASASLSSTAPSRWYVPDDHVVQGMREIQIEEQAAQEIGKLYKGAIVRFVEGPGSGHSNKIE